MRILIAETVALKPHLETAGEIALAARAAGDQVSFAWLGDDLPWSDWHLPRIARLAGCSLAPRIARFEQLLVAHGVTLSPVLSITSDDANKLRDWAYDFSGDLDDLKAYSFEDALLGMGVVSSLISWTRDSLYDPRHDLARVHACLYAAALVYARAQAALVSTKADQLITFNGRFALSKPVVEAAKKMGIPVLRHERGSTFERYACFSDAIHSFTHARARIAEAWEAADPHERVDLGHAFFKRRRAGDGLQWYSFTQGQQHGLVPPRMPGKRRVVYFTSSDDEHAAVSDVFTPGPWADQLTAARALIAACDAQGDIELVMRIHPNLATVSAAERARWDRLQGACLHTIAADNPVDSYALLDSADIVVTYGSTIGMEAAYWGKPSILIGPASHAGTHVMHEPGDDAALAALLRPDDVLTPSERARCLPYGYYYLTFGTRFHYYQPTSLSEGSFLGERLGWDPDWVYWLRKRGVGKMLRKRMRRK